MAEKISEADEEEMEDAVVGSIADLNSKLEQIQQDVEIILNPSTRFLNMFIYFKSFICFHLMNIIGCFFSAPKSPASKTRTIPKCSSSFRAKAAKTSIKY